MVRGRGAGVGRGRGNRGRACAAQVIIETPHLRQDIRATQRQAQLAARARAQARARREEERITQEARNRPAVGAVPPPASLVGLIGEVLGDMEIQHTQLAAERLALLAFGMLNEGNQSDPESVWSVLSESGILDGFDFNPPAPQREAAPEQAEDGQQAAPQPAQGIVFQELQREIGDNAADLQGPAQDDVDEFFVQQDFSVRRSARMRQQ
ncbi:hypothetical protein MIR68_011190 [Amoeboaphelidium protococcarum]|nr:hypothetical protein MIR68_011190 [Amoeboaphelidium protococcarum]